MILVLGTCDRPPSRNRNKMDSRKRFRNFFGDILPDGTTRWMNLCGEEFPANWRIPKAILMEWSAKLASRIPGDITGCVILGADAYQYGQMALNLLQIPFIPLPSTSGYCRAYNHPEKLLMHRSRLKRFLIDLSMSTRRGQDGREK